MFSPDRTRSRAAAPVVLCAAAVAVSMLAGALFRFTRAGIQPVLQPHLVSDASWLDTPTTSFQSAIEIQTSALRLLGTLVWAVILAAALVAALSFVMLVLTRHTQRKRELATRAALGAEPGTLLRELTAPILRQALTGTAIGLMVGAAVTMAARATWSGLLTRSAALSLGAGLLAALCVATLITALAILALWTFVVKGSLADALRAGERATASLGEMRLRELFTILQIGASVILLAVGFVLARDRPGAVAALETVSATAAPESVFVTPGALAAGLEPRARAAQLERLLRNTHAQPGVYAESIASAGALLGVSLSDRLYSECDNCRYSIGYVPVALMEMSMHSVGPEYFTLLGAQLLRGRDFQVHDAIDAEPVVIVNQAFAQRMFGPTGSGLGRVVRLRTGFGPAHRIIGVVADAQGSGMGAPPGNHPVVYFSALQHPPAVFDLLVRTSEAGGPALSENALQWGHTQPLNEHYAQARQPLQRSARAVRGLALLCFLVGAFGLHATTVTLVRGRQRDLAIRQALGCTAAGLMKHVSGYALRLSLLGLLLGLFGGLAAQRTLEMYLPGARLDSRAFLLIGGALLLVTLSGAARPARAAARLSGSALPR